MGELSTASSGGSSVTNSNLGGGVEGVVDGVVGVGTVAVILLVGFEPGLDNGEIGCITGFFGGGGGGIEMWTGPRFGGGGGGGG